jgi:hypothetical protein
MGFCRPEQLSILLTQAVDTLATLETIMIVLLNHLG